MYTGQCLCGDIQFEYDGPLGPVALCHCSQCRRAHGSAFSASAPVQTVRFRYVAGQDLVREFESRPGKYRAFCPRCGSQLYSRVDAIPGILRLRVGVINEPLGKRRPSTYTWGQSLTGLISPTTCPSSRKPNAPTIHTDHSAGTTRYTLPWRESVSSHRAPSGPIRTSRIRSPRLVSRSSSSITCSLLMVRRTSF